MNFEEKMQPKIAKRLIRDNLLRKMVSQILFLLTLTNQEVHISQA